MAVILRNLSVKFQFEFCIYLSWGLMNAGIWLKRQLLNVVNSCLVLFSFQNLSTMKMEGWGIMIFTKANGWVKYSRDMYLKPKKCLSFFFFPVKLISLLRKWGVNINLGLAKIPTQRCHETELFFWNNWKQRNFRSGLCQMQTNFYFPFRSPSQCSIPV